MVKSKKRYPCPYCEKDYANSSALTRHVKAKHDSLLEDYQKRIQQTRWYIKNSWNIETPPIIPPMSFPIDPFVLNIKKNLLRFTIDEKLDENLFRVLVSKLDSKRPKQDISSLDGWSEEHELFVTNLPLNKKEINELEFYNSWDYLTRFTESIIRPKWDSLKEGQVFISGYLKFLKEEEKVFITRSEDKYLFLRIDLIPQLDDFVNKLYFTVIRSDRVGISNR